jgi:uracil-DNA glycosylase
VIDKKMLPPCWRKALASEFEKDYFKDLTKFLEKEYSTKDIYPSIDEVFSAFQYTKLDDVKVIILGQDPYHGENQAHGLSFSVKPGVKIPPSLKNIYKELNTDLGLDLSDTGFLKSWAEQGVLLLNNVLTVEKSKAASHQKKGWEKFTDKVIEVLDAREDIVFILWGGPAQKKAKSVDESKHLIIKSPHPSPLSSYRGFFGSKPFSQTNNYLQKKSNTIVNWKIKGR